MAIIAAIFFIKGSYYNELLNSNIWMTGRQSISEGKIEINMARAKRNFWGKWFQ